MPTDAFCEGLPEWLPNESLFSLVSRYHRLAGYSAPHYTAKALFSSPRSGWQHDLPSGIDHFVTATNAIYGVADDIVQSRTMLPFFTALRGVEAKKNAIAAMRSPRIGSLKYQLGLTASRLRAHHPLRHCSRCAQSDIDRFGVAYWHLEHQLPGTTLCLDHEVPLVQSAAKSTGLYRFAYLLPDCNETPLQIDDRGTDIARTFADIAQELWEAGRLDSISARIVRESCRSALGDKGLLTERNSVRVKLAGPDYADFISPLRQVPTFSALPFDKDHAGREVSRLVHRPRGHPHPIRYICLIAWLFGSLSACLEYAPTVQPAEVGRSGTDKKRFFLSLLLDRGLSIVHASRSAGVDHATGVGWAEEAGVRVSRRPKKIDEQTRRRIVQGLREGRSKPTLADRYGLSLVSISRVMRSTPGLASAWEDARRLRRQHIERERWRRLVKSHGHLGVKLMRQIAPATYAWLYRNDRAWFDKSRSRLDRIRITPTGRIDWQKRDRELALSIQKVASRLIDADPNTRITFGVLCQNIEDLKPRLSQTKQLPLTRKALQRALKGKRASGEPLPLRR